MNVTMAMPMAINISFAADEKRPAICHFNKFDDVAAAAEIDAIAAKAKKRLVANFMIRVCKC